MALQTSIAQYFNSRKRQAVDDVKGESKPTNKVLILDKSVTNSPLGTASSDSPRQVAIPAYDESPKVSSGKRVSSQPRVPRKTPRVSSSKKKAEKVPTKRSDIRRSLLSSFQTCDVETAGEKGQEGKKEEVVVSDSVNVPFLIKGVLSPKKVCPSTKEGNDLKKKESSSAQANEVQSTTLPSESEPSTSNDLSIQEIKSKIVRSYRLEEIKARLKRINEGYEKLATIKSKDIPKALPVTQQTPCTPVKHVSFKDLTSTPTKPTLKEFKSIELEVITSPSKTPMKETRGVYGSPSLLRRAAESLKSPSKGLSATYISPRKLFDEKPTSPAKSPAYKKYRSLVEAGKPALVLPYKYRLLAECFRSIDTVSSMFVNRKETLTFNMLKKSVPELIKRDLTEKELAQILTVYPNCYKFHYEKIRSFGATGEKYELIATPILDDVPEEDKKKYNNAQFHPFIGLHRRRVFFNNLISIVKEHHERFLLSLDPPLVVPKHKLMRWHAEFDLENIPEVAEAALPQPPNIEMFSSAKDVLNKARDLFNVNPRMEKALMKLSENQQGQVRTSASASIPALANALKGIPKSLLEKVRAKQAAKALELLTRPPVLSSVIIDQKRLPDVARIIRNLFVGERKNVLNSNYVLEKVQSSLREELTTEKIAQLLNLIIEHVPGWLTSHVVEQVKYFKLNKTMEMENVFSKLNSLTANVDA